jgi:ABC-2 type transport system permease protein
MSTKALSAQARAELLMTMRRGENVVVTLVIPLGVLLFFGKVDTLTNLADPVAFLVPGTLALAVMAAAMVSLGIATGYERRYGVLKRLGTTPLSRGGLLTAKTATVLALEVLQAVLIVATGVALGWKLNGGIVPAIIIILVGTVAFAGIGLLMAGTLRAEATLGLANGLFLVLLFLGGMAYPIDRLPAGLEALAKALPSGALSESLRSVLDPSRSFATGEFIILVLWAIGASVAAARFFRWEE